MFSVTIPCCPFPAMVLRPCLDWTLKWSAILQWLKATFGATYSTCPHWQACNNAINNPWSHTQWNASYPLSEASALGTVMPNPSLPCDLWDGRGSWVSAGWLHDLLWLKPDHLDTLFSELGYPWKKMLRLHLTPLLSSRILALELFYIHFSSFYNGVEKAIPWIAF